MATAKKAEEKKPEPELTAAEVEKMPVRLFNVLTHWNFYVLAKDHADAREAASTIILGGQQPPFEQVAYETRRERDVQQAWHEQAPWCSASIPEQPEETTLQAFQRLYMRRG